MTTIFYFLLFFGGMFLQTKSFDFVNKFEKKENLRFMNVIFFISLFNAFALFSIYYFSSGDISVMEDLKKMLLNGYIYLIFFMEAMTFLLYKKVFKDNPKNFSFIGATLLSSLYMIPVVTYAAFEYFNLRLPHYIAYSGKNSVFAMSFLLFILSIIYSYSHLKIKGEINNIIFVVLLNISVIITLFGSAFFAQTYNSFLYFSTVSFFSAALFFPFVKNIQRKEIFHPVYIFLPTGWALSIFFIANFPVEMIVGIKRVFQIIINKVIDLQNGSSLRKKDIFFIVSVIITLFAFS